MPRWRDFLPSLPALAPASVTASTPGRFLARVNGQAPGRAHARVNGSSANGHAPRWGIEPIIRAFAAGGGGRLLSSWLANNKPLNDHLREDLDKVRGRSRQLARDDPHARRFLRLVEQNVIGAGITLQAQPVNLDGTPDRSAATQIELAWDAWGRAGSCEITGRHSWRDLQLLAAKSIARDGEAMFLHVVDDTGYRLQWVNPDRLDIAYTGTAPGGNLIIMGVELSKLGQPVAYYFWTQHPAASLQPRDGRQRVRVEAWRVLHLFLPDEGDQARGVPWLHASAAALHNLGEYKTAEMVAARIAACKVGFYKTETTDFSGDGAVESSPDNPADSQLEESLEAGTFQRLRPGLSVETWDPQHPTDAFSPFIKTELRGAAAGMNVSYNLLAQDLEGVNFSSLRAGYLDEQEGWRLWQLYLCEHFCTPIYENWLASALGRDLLASLPRTKIEKFKRVRWQPRGWEWVDPAKEAQGAETELRLGLTTRRRIVAKRGEDWDEIVTEAAQEAARLKELGLPSGLENPPPPAAPAVQMSEDTTS